MPVDFDLLQIVLSEKWFPPNARPAPTSGSADGSMPRTVDGPPRTHGPRSRPVSITITVFDVPSLICPNFSVRSYPNTPTPGESSGRVAAAEPVATAVQRGTTTHRKPEPS